MEELQHSEEGLYPLSIFRLVVAFDTIEHHVLKKIFYGVDCMDSSNVGGNLGFFFSLCDCLRGLLRLQVEPTSVSSAGYSLHMKSNCLNYLYWASRLGAWDNMNKNHRTISL